MQDTFLGAGKMNQLLITSTTFQARSRKIFIFFYFLTPKRTSQQYFCNYTKDLVEPGIEWRANISTVTLSPQLRGLSGK